MGGAEWCFYLIRPVIPTADGGVSRRRNGGTCLISESLKRESLMAQCPPSEVAPLPHRQSPLRTVAMTGRF